MRWSLRRSMSCGEVLVVLQSYLDGETEAGVARQVVGHLERCTHCEDERRMYAGIKTSLTAHRHRVDPEIMSALSAFGQRLARGESR